MQTKKKTAPASGRRLRLAAPAPSTSDREATLSRVRDARRSLEAARATRFAYLKRVYD